MAARQAHLHPETMAGDEAFARGASVSIVMRNVVDRARLAALFGQLSEFSCHGAYANGRQALRGMALNSPAVVLIDADLRPMPAPECVSRLKDQQPQLRVLLLATDPETDPVIECLRAGADGCVMKHSPAAE